jgi:hypothetical protein
VYEMVYLGLEELMTIYRIVIGENWQNTKAIASCSTLSQAKESAKKYALEGWYFAIYKADDDNPMGELVGRWTYSHGRVKKFYMPGEKSTKPKNIWK